MKDTEPVFYSDVVVVGAGAAGVLISKRFSDLGYRCTLVEKSAIGAGQSNHSHGYLHRGHIYQRPSVKLVNSLNDGASWWIEEFDSLGFKPVTVSSKVGFSNHRNAEIAVRAWEAANLSFERTDVPGSMNRSKFSDYFTTRERTYNFTEWYLHSSAKYLINVTQVHGEVTQVHNQIEGLQETQVRTNHGRLTLKSSVIILCAGIENLRILNNSTRHRGRTVNRNSFMMVIEARGLDEISFVSPENETYGLFLVSRNTHETTRWLVSNYFSFGASENTAQTELKWRVALSRTLANFTNSLDPERDPRWGTYLAPKGELRRDVQHLNEHSIEQVRRTQIFIASPSKLTLVPLLAEQVINEVQPFISAVPSTFSAHEHPAVSVIPVAREAWMSTNLRPISSIRKLN